MVKLSIYDIGVYNDFIYNAIPSSGIALVLDGKNKSIATGFDPVELNFANAWSISVWAKPEPDKEFRTLFCIENSRRENRIKLSTAPVSDETPFLFDRQTDLRVELTDSNGTVIQNHGWESFFQDQTWAHVGVTWDGTSLVSYIDGVSGTTSVILIDGGGVLSDAPRTIFYGYGLTEGVASWSGTIGPAAIWNTALGPEEWPVIASGLFDINLSASSGTYTSNDSLVQYWSFQNEDDIGENLTGNGAAFTRLRSVSDGDFTNDIPTSGTL